MIRGVEACRYLGSELPSGLEKKNGQEARCSDKTRSYTPSKCHLKLTSRLHGKQILSLHLYFSPLVFLIGRTLWKESIHTPREYESYY